MIEEFLLKVIRKLETEFNVTSWAYKEYNSTKTHMWWMVGLNDYEIYSHNSKFKALSKAYHIIAKKNNINLVFVYQNVSEEILSKLSDEDNLILNL